MGIVLISSCKKTIETSTIRLNETVDTTSMGAMAAIAKYAGTFGNGAYGTVTGNAKIYLVNGRYSLALENFNTNNGPDLHVYLSKEVQPINFIDLGKLKSTNGNQVYEISGMPNFTEYKYALIHCQQYNHLFGSAELK